VISAWLDLPIAGIFAALAIVYGLTAMLISWLTFRSPLQARIDGTKGLVAPFFVSVAILFALMTSFLAADIMSQNRQADRIVHVEGGALSSLHALSLASADDMAEIHGALHAYLDAVVNDEWKRMADGQASAKAETALSALLRAVTNPKIAQVGGAVHSGIVNVALQAATARSDRLALSSHHSDDVKWATVLFLCLMTQVAIGMVHLERPNAHTTALTIFTIAANVSLSLIAIQENPFGGAISVSPAPLERVLASVKT